MAADASQQDRVIRVFISSTFRDMQQERDELVLRVFPQVRKLCESRGVTWGEVDLRWGISDEQKAEGKVLPICLEEIRRCRPYFIGLLGERYGWVPDDIPPEVIEREPWVREHVHGKTSVTELEVLHGVLNNPEMAEHALFYFRDPLYVNEVADERREDFISEDAVSRHKLRRLKQDVWQHHRDGKLKYAPRENYPDPQSLGRLVLADLTEIIDDLFPAGSQLDSLDREVLDHAAYAQSRAGVYIGRQEYFARLDAHVASDSSPLVVLGESGIGKSALLANWFLRYVQQYPGDVALLHFVGGTPDSADHAKILRRIMLELRRRFDLPGEVPTEPEKIREAFPGWLVETAGRGRIVLVLDGLNQLEDVDNAPDLGWLPRVFPKNCRVILSALPGRSLDAIERRGWLEATAPLEVQPLDEAERRRLVQQFLAQYARDLGRVRTDRLVRAEHTTNPLYLRAVLDELRQVGVHEKLDEQLTHYLEATTPKELYLRILARWEQVYSENCELVSRSLRLIWASRRGLSEAELMDLLGEDGQPLPGAVWAPFYLAAESGLTVRSGLLGFAHDYLRQAVEQKYLGEAEIQRVAHRELADYFDQQTEWTPRNLDELPWQLAAANEWPRLHDTLTDANGFIELYERNEYELLGYWLQLQPQYDLAASYTAAFARWSQNLADTAEWAWLVNKLAGFIQEAGHYIAAEPLYRLALEIDEQELGGEHPDVARDLNDLAGLLRDTNQFAEAEPLSRRALAIWEQTFGPDHPEVATVLNNLAELLRTTNRLTEAEFLYRRSLSIAERSFGPEHPDVALKLNNLGLLLQTTNWLAEAEPLMRRTLAIWEQSLGPEHPLVATALNNLAELLRSTNQLAEAEPLYRRALAIDEQSFGPDHPVIARDLNNLALSLQVMNRLAEAEPLYRRALVIEEQSLGPEHPTVATTLNNLAELLRATNRLAEAEPLYRRALAIDEQSFGADHPDVARDLNNLSLLLRAANRPGEAEPLLCRAVDILKRFNRDTGDEHPSYRIIQMNFLAVRAQRLGCGVWACIMLGTVSLALAASIVCAFCILAVWIAYGALVAFVVLLLLAASISFVLTTLIVQLVRRYLPDHWNT